MQNYTRIGTLGLLALVALRIGIGWHFFKEGSDKIKSGTFSSEPFLKGAQGRLAGFFHGMVWDNDGKIRLDEELMLSKVNEGVDAASRHFGFTDSQIGQVKKQAATVANNLKDVYAENSDAIYKYFKSEARVDKMEHSPTWNDIASLRGQKNSIEKERMSAVMPAIQSVDAVWNRYETILNQSATAEQYKASGRFALKRPREGAISSSVVDRIIPVFDLTVGILLIVGLFVPLAGWAAALFLFSVVLSQWPGDPNTTPTYFNAVEALALIALATIGAGRFAGLDFLFWAWRQNRKVAQA